ncbi:MAG: hypothetical protein ACO22U_14975 [bacterium]
MTDERVEKVKALVKMCRSILCYLPRAQNGKGPKELMLEAIENLEEDEWNQ